MKKIAHPKKFHYNCSVLVSYNTTMIEISNLDFGYRKKSPLFDQLSLTIESGKIVGLLGANGVGKSSLIKLIAGLVFKKSGAISTLNYDPARRHSSMLQDVYLLPEETTLSGKSILWHSTNIGCLYPKFDHQLLRDLLDCFDVPVKSTLYDMSLGQRKKAQIAFALATNTRLLLLDEPTNGLDIAAKSQFRQIIASSMTDERTIVISTHQIRDLDTMLDQIVILKNGKCVFNKNVHEIMYNYLFLHGLKSTDGLDILYKQQHLGTYSVVAKADRGETSRTDYELLYNAVISNPLNFH